MNKHAGHLDCDGGVDCFKRKETKNIPERHFLIPCDNYENFRS